MIKNFLLLIILITSTLICFSQNNDTIEIRKNRFYLNDKLLNYKEIKSVLRTDKEAYRKYKVAETLSWVSNGISYVGGFMIGYPIGTWAAGGQPEWNMLYIGCGLFGVGLAIAFYCDNQVKEAIQIFNYNRNNNLSYYPKIEGKLGFTNHGIGFSLNF